MNFFFSFLQWLHNDDSIIDCDTTKFLSEKFTEVKMLARCYLYSDTGFLVVASFERLFLSWWKVLLQLPWFYSEHRTSADIQGSNVKSLWAFHTAIHPRARASLFACFYYVPVFFVELSVLLSYGVKNDDTDRTANDMCIARTKRLNPLLLSLDVRSVGVSSKTLSQYRGSKQGDATRYYV